MSLKLLFTTSVATLALSTASLVCAESIVIGVPAAQSGPVGIADHQDFVNGLNMAIDEINAQGGVAGNMLEAKVVDIDILTPEGTITAFQSLIDADVKAIASPFVLIPQTAMDVTAASGIPYLHGNTSKASLDLVAANASKYSNVFQLDVDETHYGSGFINYITHLKASAQFTPKNNKVHIVQGQIAYTQTISQATQAAIAASNGEWEIGAITDIQFPVQDWAPVISALKQADAGVIMIDHWVAAELAAFANAYAYDAVPGALVYLQYGPSQPEFLELAAGTAEGMIWGTVYGVYADAKGQEFRSAYQDRYAGTMGLVYSGAGYDAGYLLAQAWTSADANDFSAVNATLKNLSYRGVNGHYSFNNATQSATSYPNMTQDLEAGQGHLFFQVQGDEHKIIAPPLLAETQLVPAPWM